MIFSEKFNFTKARGKAQVKISKEGNSYQVSFSLKEKEILLEQKYNGARYALVYSPEGILALSRHISVETKDFVNKAENIPHLTKVKNPFKDLTIIDGEMIFGDKYSTSNTKIMTIMGSLPDRALALQKEKQVEFIAFDILFYEGKDLRKIPLIERKAFLKKAIVLLKNPYIKESPWRRVLTEANSSSEIDKAFSKVISSGGEGLMLKYPNSLYEEAPSWIKVKKKVTYDVIVMSKRKDTTSSRYKKLGWIRSLEVGLYNDKGNMVSLGYCSNFTEAKRAQFSKSDSIVESVIEIAAQGILKNKKGSRISFQNARFIQERPDKAPKECLLSDYEW